MNDDSNDAELNAQEECERRHRELPHVYRAISEVTAAIAKTGIAKDRKNVQQGYAFRGIDDVYNALSAHLSAAGLCVLPRVLSRELTERQTQKGGVLFYVVLHVQFDLVSAVDGSRHTITVYGEAMDSGDKATNKAMSAAYKYACMQTFCIPTEGDNDADAQTHEVAPRLNVHNPRDGMDAADPKAVKAAADRMQAALDLNADEDAVAVACYDVHDGLKREPEVYVAASDELQKRIKGGKATWKKLVERGRELAHSPAFNSAGRAA